MFDMNHLRYIKQLVTVWQQKIHFVNWIAYENFVVEVLKDDLPCEIKVKLMKEAIDAFTRRGHFMK